MNSIPIHTLNRNESFPELWDVPFSPEKIQIQGKPEALQLLGKLPSRGFAVVGTRYPQPRTLALTDEWISALAGFDLIIVSGLARGIDTRAHESALKHGIPTVAVIGCGIRHPTYPPENESLRHRILEAGGLVISEFYEDSPPAAENFIRRNRLIAAWSKATWVVEASHRSGALNTANWARKMDRDCFVTPCFPGDRALAGNQKLLERSQALAFLSPHNLSGCWPEFQSWFDQRDKKRRLKRSLESVTPDVRILTGRVQQLTCSQGGATVHELLNWAFLRGWMPERFFQTLENALKSRFFFDHQGVLSTSEQPVTNN